MRDSVATQKKTDQCKALACRIHRELPEIYFPLPVVFLLVAVFLAVAVFFFGDRFAEVFLAVVFFAADFFVAVFFFGDRFAVGFVVDFFAAAFFVAVRFLVERVVVLVAGFFVVFFVAAIGVAPDLGDMFRDWFFPGALQGKTRYVSRTLVNLPVASATGFIRLSKRKATALNGLTVSRLTAVSHLVCFTQVCALNPIYRDSVKTNCWRTWH